MILASSDYTFQKQGVAIATTNISRLDEFGTCPQKYEWHYEHGKTGIVPKRETTPELDLGSAIHAGLASWYTNWDKRVAFDAYYAAIDTQAGAEDHPQISLGERMLEAYLRYYEQADRDWTVLAVERAFRFPLGTDVLLGRWDMIVRSKSLGSLLHVQHKTTGSRDLTSYVRQYNLSWHERLYVPAAAVEFPGEQIGGTLLNILRKSSFKDGRVLPDQDFLRYYVPTVDVARFQRDVQHRIGLVEEAKRSGVWEQQTKACVLYNRRCPYMDLCLGLPIDITTEFDKRESDYVDEERTR